MSKDFKEFITECEIKRLDFIENQFDTLEEIQLLKAKAEKLENQILDFLPEEFHSSLSSYEDILFEIGVKKSTHFYKQGLRDGLAFGNTFFRDKNDFNVTIKVY